MHFFQYDIRLKRTECAATFLIHVGGARVPVPAVLVTTTC